VFCRRIHHILHTIQGSFPILIMKTKIIMFFCCMISVQAVDLTINWSGTCGESPNLQWRSWSEDYQEWTSWNTIAALTAGGPNPVQVYPNYAGPYQWRIVGTTTQTAPIEGTTLNYDCNATGTQYPKKYYHLPIHNTGNREQDVYIYIKETGLLVGSGHLNPGQAGEVVTIGVDEQVDLTVEMQIGGSQGILGSFDVQSDDSGWTDSNSGGGGASTYETSVIPGFSQAGVGTSYTNIVFENPNSDAATEGTLKTGLNAIRQAILDSAKNIGAGIGKANDTLQGGTNLLGRIDGKLGGLGTNIASSLTNGLSTNSFRNYNAEAVDKGEDLANEQMSSMNNLGSELSSGSYTAPSSYTLDDIPIGGYYLTIDPLRISGVASIASYSKAMITWVASLLLAIAMFKVYREHYLSMTQVNQATTSGTSVMGTNFNGVFAFAAGLIIVGMWCLLPAWFATHFNVLGIVGTLLGNPNAEASGMMANSIGLISNFVDISLLMRYAMAYLTFSATIQPIYWLASVTMKLVVGA